MKTLCLIAFLLVVLIFIVINVCTITETINGSNRYAVSVTNGNNNLRSNTNDDDENTPKQESLLSSKTTTTTNTTPNNKHNTLSISTTIAAENTETLLSMMTLKLMTMKKIEISTVKPSNFNKNSLWQRKEQQTTVHQQKQQHQQKQNQQKQQSPQQRYYKHQYTLDNKHPPCSYVEHTSSIVTGGVEKTTTITAIHNRNNTNLDNKIRTMTTTQIDATAKGYKPLISLNTSNSIDTNNIVSPPSALTLLSTSTSSPSSTFNVARNGFRDKINISNQQNEFTSEVDDNDSDDNDSSGGDKDDEHNDENLKDLVQVLQSTLKPLQKYNTNIKNGLNIRSINVNSNTNSASSVNNYVAPAMSSFFEHVELAESRLSPDKRHELLLHRRKRYLVFPEGSSFQLVFDLIIGIVDYTNYAILGITCSVAWELPSKPPSEIIENVHDKLKEGTYGLQRRNDSVSDKELQYIETHEKNPTKLTTTTSSKTIPKQPTNIGYENAWKPQKYIDTGNWNNNELKYAPKITTTASSAASSAAIPTATTSFYEYKARHKYENNKNQENAAVGATVSDLASGTGFVEAQRKTLNDKAAQWQWQWNRQKPDKSYLMYDKKYSTKKNYDWRGNDKWKYAAAPYIPSNDWRLEQRTSNSNSDTVNLKEQDDYITDSVNFDEKQQQRKNYTNWRQKNNWWQQKSQPWRGYQRWSQYENHGEKWKSGFSKTPIETVTTYAAPIYRNNNRNYARTGRQRKILKEPPKHRIYPVFGRKKRSLKNNEHSLQFELVLDRIHFREQLQSRQKLYGKIEQLFQTRGHNGTACVLRALCETGQRHQLPLHHLQHSHHQHHHHNHQQQEPHSTASQQSGPQSFITELLRAIFALPKDIRSREFESEALQSHAGRRPSTGLHPNATHEMLLEHEYEAQISWHYRDAHAFTGNCAERFASCEHSIWNDGIRHSGVVGRAFKM